MAKLYLSVIVPTLNCERNIGYFLDSLNSQSYHKARLEVIISDGGSSDRTIRIAAKYKVKLIHNPYRSADAGVYQGMLKARGKLIMVLAVDNFFKEKNAIETIVKSFENKGIFAAFPKQASLPHDSLYTKYFNIFTDPFNHFLYGYAANARTFRKVYKTQESNNIYDIYDFLSADIKPVLSLAQGFTVRREIIKMRRSKFDDVKPVYELITARKKIAYLHSITIYHRTCNGVYEFIKKTLGTAQVAISKQDYGIAHRLNYLTSWQKIKIYLYPFYALSIILPLIISLKGFIKERERIWLFHPIITFISASAIMFQIFVSKFGSPSAAVRNE